MCKVVRRHGLSPNRQLGRMCIKVSVCKTYYVSLTYMLRKASQDVCRYEQRTGQDVALGLATPDNI